MRFWSRPSSRAAHQNIQRTIKIVTADTTATMIPAAVIPDSLPAGTVAPMGSLRGQRSGIFSSRST